MYLCMCTMYVFNLIIFKLSINYIYLCIYVSVYAYIYCKLHTLYYVCIQFNNIIY
jgi:hypothetical protein